MRRLACIYGVISIQINRQKTRKKKVIQNSMLFSKSVFHKHRSKICKIDQLIHYTKCLTKT